MESAFKKALGVFDIEKEADYIIGCDTIVVINDKILEKPKNEEDAFEMLSLLSDKEHTVCTGLAILSKKEKKIICEQTKVKFSKLTKEMIESYIQTKEPM